jgi:hypothetical protein
MKISELKASIREMIVNELEEATYAGKDAKADLQKDPKFSSLNTQAKTAAFKDLEGGGSVTLQEEDALMEMAKIAGDLKIAIEKVIEKNKDAEKKDVRKAIKTDDEVQAALGDEDLFDNQLNKFIDLIRGEREVGQRGRKASEKPEGEPKEKGTRGRPKSATPAAKKKEDKPKTFSVGTKKYYAGSEDEEGPSDKELKQLARSGGKFDKSKLSQLRQQEKTKIVRAFLKDMQSKGVVDSANRVLDKDAYAKEWADAKVDIEAKVAAIN